MNKEAYLLPIFICCVWPIVSPILATYAWRWFTKHDWKNVDLSKIPDLWRKDE